MNFLICDLQYGSTGKGAIAYYLAKSRNAHVAVSANAPNAGHTAVDGERRFVHSVLPVSAAAPSVDSILVGPGSVFDVGRLVREYQHLRDSVGERRLFIHPSAVPLRAKDLEDERALVTIGSTMKGTAAANHRRMMRGNDVILGQIPDLRDYIREQLPGTPISFDRAAYMREIQRDNKIIEGAQGFSLSVYHGFYPYVTSRDTTPNQIAADCALPGDYRRNTTVVGSIRTFPIRVANRMGPQGELLGSSGPCYADQRELEWSDIGRAAELTTVTKLPRRLFSFSIQQIAESKATCAPDAAFLSFADYCTPEQLQDRLTVIDGLGLKVGWTGHGPDYADIMEVA